MRIDYLEEFVVLAKASSILEASKTLKVVPSTLSRHLSAMEVELGFKLIDRTTTSFNLTTKGELFFERAVNTLEAYSMSEFSATKEIESPKETVIIGGHLRLMGVANLITSTTSYCVRNRYSVLPLPYYPHTFGSVLTFGSNDPIKTAKKGHVDVSLLVGCEQDDLSQFESVSLFHEPTSLLFSAGLEIAQHAGPVDLYDFKDFTFVLPPFYPSLTNRFLQICEAVGFRPIHRYKFYRSYGDLYACRNNREVFISGRHEAKKLPPVRLSGLEERDIANPEAYLDIKAAWSKDGSSSRIETTVSCFKEVSEILEGQPYSWTSLTC
ncbi:MAG: LysR family transcriptional regulator [Coriobacteriia bacterium]|nr:LysR family transcriptional regulator [Coriobacteriia bacterium]MCL2749646.1 LysR family transcriptional regulator [Coriobacteriia bacterium]